MNYIDLLLLLIIIWCVWTGVQRGFIVSSFMLLSWAGSLAAGFIVYKPLGVLLLKVFPSLTFWAYPLAFFVGIIAARVILDYLVTYLLQRIPRRVHHNVINQTGGIVPGLLNGYISAALLAAFLLLVPVANEISAKTRQSSLASRLTAGVGWLNGRLSPVFGEALNHATPMGHDNSTEINGNEFVKLPFTVKEPKTRPDLEAKMLQMVNKERAARGLNPLKADAEMTIVARKHSADMFARGYFSHYTPEGADPFKRMEKDKLHFLTAGENLAIAPTLLTAHNGLMHSPGHRANILNPAFGRLGIGILDGGVYGLMITQDFRN